MPWPRCRDYIQKQFGDKYLPEEPRVYSSKEGAQEAHEAIRPTDVHRKAAPISAAWRRTLRGSTT